MALDQRAYIKDVFLADLAPPIPELNQLPLALTVAFSGFGMRAPVGLLIIGTLGAPLACGCPTPPGHTPGQLEFCAGGNRPGDAAGTLAGCKRDAGVGAGMDEDFAGSTDSSGSRSMRLLRNRKGFQLLRKADNAV